MASHEVQRAALRQEAIMELISELHRAEEEIRRNDLGAAVVTIRHGITLSRGLNGFWLEVMKAGITLGRNDPGGGN